MDDKKWEQFFETMREIVDGPGSFKEKAGEVSSAAENLGEIATLEEFASWFSGD